jgi:hypothetical protein
MNGNRAIEWLRVRWQIAILRIDLMRDGLTKAVHGDIAPQIQGE